MGKIIENIPPLVVLKNIDEKELDRKRVHIEVLFEQTGFDKRTNRRHACETQRNYNGQIDRKTRKRKKKYWRNMSKNRSKVWLFILAVLFIDIAATWPFTEISVWISRLSLFFICDVVSLYLLGSIGFFLLLFSFCGLVCSFHQQKKRAKACTSYEWVNLHSEFISSHLQ